MTIKPWKFNRNKDRLRRSLREEGRIADVMGGRRLPRSGGLPWSADDPTTAGGDVVTPTLHIEHKRVEPPTKSIRITREWLAKVTAGARRTVRVPSVVITFEEAKGHDKDWALVPLSFVKRLTDVVELEDEEK